MKRDDLILAGVGLFLAVMAAKRAEKTAEVFEATAKSFDDLVKRGKELIHSASKGAEKGAETPPEAPHEGGFPVDATPKEGGTETVIRGDGAEEDDPLAGLHLPQELLEVWEKEGA